MLLAVTIILRLSPVVAKYEEEKQADFTTTNKIGAILG